MKNILKSTKYVTLAMCRNNEPYLVTLSHGYDDLHNCIYFHCAKDGKKIDFLSANSRVWGQAFIDQGYQEGQCNQLYTSAQFSGKVTFLQSLDEKLEAVKCIIRQLEKNPEQSIAMLKPERLESTVFGRVDIDFMTGKKPEEKT